MTSPLVPRFYLGMPTLGRMAPKRRIIPYALFFPPKQSQPEAVGGEIASGAVGGVPHNQGLDSPGNDSLGVSAIPPYLG
ncbi:MAG: hypothetical protein GDA56_30535 [Hormoscilla sp. GM7CHS1pb]|nr:hypothetical protein [Hormoscilla sp. GM7CHS1pb]